MRRGSAEAGVGGRPRVLDEEKLRESLETVISKWTVDDRRFPALGHNRDLAAIDRALDRARRRVQDPPAPDFEDLLRLLAAPEQIDAALATAFETTGTRLLANELARSLVERQRSLGQSERRFPQLQVKVNVKLRSMDIPDPGRDELDLTMVFYSGIALEAFQQYVAATHLGGVDHAQALVKRWRLSDTLIGRDEDERLMLDRCLDVHVDRTVARQIMSVNHNIGVPSGTLWREAVQIVKIRAPLNLARYPFDASPVTLRLSKIEMDTSELVLLPEFGYQSPMVLEACEPPRGYFIVGDDGDHIEATLSVSDDVAPFSILESSFTLWRRPSAVAWRTLAPLAVILVLADFAAFRTVVLDIDMESVKTQLLPTILIACVALQLVASDKIPPGASATLLDRVFLVSYAHLLALYFAVDIGLHPAAPFLVGVDAAVLVLVLLYLLLQMWLFARKASQVKAMRE